MSKRRRRAQKTFLNVPVVDAGARGKSVAKTEEGEVIFLTDAVPGDVVDIQTFKKKKSFYEGKVTRLIETTNIPKEISNVRFTSNLINSYHLETNIYTVIKP